VGPKAGKTDRASSYGGREVAKEFGDLLRSMIEMLDGDGRLDSTLMLIDDSKY
jgi:hypothetical protein